VQKENTNSEYNRSLQALQWKGSSLLEQSQKSDLLFVFVRHKGCTFCREALSELAKNLSLILKKGLKPVIVHMGPESTSEELKKEYGLDSVEWISDPQKKFYAAFGLKRGSLKQLFGPRVWARGFVAGVMNGHGLGPLEGDGFQMGGIYLLSKGNLSKLHDPCDAADIGDWKQILENLKI
jgi:hypothetical protein